MSRFSDDMGEARDREASFEHNPLKNYMGDGVKTLMQLAGVKGEKAFALAIPDAIWLDPKTATPEQARMMGRGVNFLLPDGLTVSVHTAQKMPTHLLVKPSRTLPDFYVLYYASAKMDRAKAIAWTTRSVVRQAPVYKFTKGPNIALTHNVPIKADQNGMFEDMWLLYRKYVPGQVRLPLEFDEPHDVPPMFR
jgi:hypothetical protein